VTIRGDLAEEGNWQRAVDQAVHELGGLDILVNNVATQQPVKDFAELTTGRWDRTFKVNIYSYFWITTAAYRHLPDGGAVINTASINGLRGAQVPMGRAAHPDEIAPSYVFFAAGRMSSYYSGEVLAPVGGETMPG
jgi:NAD(P)-dependent dehydrogenase (short-subunit alcohol dehydrogenase family)